MSTLRVSSINNAAASAGGIAIDSSGGVSGALPAPNRNLLYNGAMQVSQRGTSTTGITSTGYLTADRWLLGLSGLGTWTQDIQNDAPTGSGFRRSYRLLCTTADAAPAAGDNMLFRQALEGQDLQRIRKGTSSSQRLTLSFWVKTNVTGTYICELSDEDNSRTVSASYSIAAGDSGNWVRRTIAFPVDTTGALDNDNALSFIASWWLGAGSTFTSGTLQTTWGALTAANRAVGQTNLAAAINNYWQITGVQLETGDVATDFEFKSFGQELRECQRYYYRVGGPAFSSVGAAVATSATEARIWLSFPTTMRTNIGTSSNAHQSDWYLEFSAAGKTVTAAQTSGSTSTGTITLTTSAISAGAAGHGYTGSGGNGFAAWSAEL